MEGAGTSEEDDDIYSQDSNIHIEHGHLARNSSIKIITPAVKAFIINFHIDFQNLMILITACSRLRE